MVQSLANAFNAGGPFMWVILAVFIVACAVVLERLIFYFLICKPNGARLVADAAAALNAGDGQKARKTVSKRKAPLNMLMQSAVDGFLTHGDYAEIQKDVDQAVVREMPRLTQRLNYLSLFANIGTLLGLLGTIIGLQEMFGSLAAVEAEKKAAMLASGIAQAMNATAFGLIVAVPCMVVYTMFHNKQLQITKDIDESMLRLMNFLEKKCSLSRA